MNFFIEVDYTEFERAADAVEDYAASQKQKMTMAGQEVTKLGASWQGKDFQQFQAKWNQIDDRSSTAGALQQSLEDYAKALRYAADQYKKAQKKAIDKANSL